jgi:haloalkane dehalogenase
VLAALKEDTRAKLFLWADSDPVLTLKTGERFAAVCNTEIDHVIPDAGHFLQEDQGELIGRHIAAWLS